MYESTNAYEDLLVSSKDLSLVWTFRSPWPGVGSFWFVDDIALAFGKLIVFFALVMYEEISSNGTTSLGSSMALRARSMSGRRCSTVLMRFSQICVQNQSLPAVAFPSRILIVISKSQDSFLKTLGGIPQNGSRSW